MSVGTMVLDLGRRLLMFTYAKYQLWITAGENGVPHICFSGCFVLNSAIYAAWVGLGLKKKAWIQCRIRHLNNNFSFSYTAVLSHWGMLVRVQPSCISGIIYCACNSALKSKWGPRVEYIQHAVIYSYENHYWFILLVSWRMLMERGRNGDGIWMWL